MSDIFTLDHFTDFSEKINIGELYETKRKNDLGKLELFNKLLNRIHVRIKTTARQKPNEHFCWYLVPEVILGVPRYNQPACIEYLMNKLTTNKFNVKYIHPNTLFISWIHWIPTYVRTELKKKTGVEIDEFGNKLGAFVEIEEEPDHRIEDEKKVKKKGMVKKPAKKYTSVDEYHPQNNIIYSDALLNP